MDEMIENAEKMECSFCGSELFKNKVCATNIDGGVEIEIHAHYGSKHDGLRAYGLVCDSCIDELLTEGKCKFLSVK